MEAIAKFDYSAAKDDELSMKENQVLNIIGT